MGRFIPNFDERLASIAASSLSEAEKSVAYQAAAADYFRAEGGEPYNAADYEWSIEPPDDDDTCRTCYEWRRYPQGQQHFGFAWWRVCDSRLCDHEHHLTEVWMAAS